MRNIFIIAIVVASFNSQLTGAFSAATTCLNVAPIGSPANFFNLQLNELNTFLQDGTGKTFDLVHLSTQIVAGMNFKAIFKLTEGDMIQWVGILAYRNLKNVITITKYIKSNDVTDIFNIFNLDTLTEENLIVLDCGNLFDIFKINPVVVPTHPVAVPVVEPSIPIVDPIVEPIDPVIVEPQPTDPDVPIFTIIKGIPDEHLSSTKKNGDIIYENPVEITIAKDLDYEHSEDSNNEHNIHRHGKGLNKSWKKDSHFNHLRNHHLKPSTHEENHLTEEFEDNSDLLRVNFVGESNDA
jgi:hypothetical protein